MPTTTTIFVGSRFAGVSARNDKFPRLSDIAACRHLLDLPASSLRAGRIAAALACVPRLRESDANVLAIRVADLATGAA